jgi:hypothetical protein
MGGPQNAGRVRYDSVFFYATVRALVALGVSFDTPQIVAARPRQPFACAVPHISDKPGTECVAESFAASSDQSAISECKRLSHARLACSYVSLSSFCRLVALVLIMGASIRGMIRLLEIRCADGDS